MNSLLHGVATRAVHHLRKSATAHAKVMEGVATHAEKEAVRRQEALAKAKLNETLSRPLRTLDQ